MEGDVELAIALLESRAKEKRSIAYGWDRVDLEVAKAAEKSHPQTALRIYRREAEQLIDARGRSSYESACGYLKKVRNLYKAVDRTDD